jgi:hypothetical protein
MYEFANCNGDDGEGQEAENCELIMKQNNVNPDDAWWYWLALCGLFVGFRVAAILVLRKRGRFFA